MSPEQQFQSNQEFFSTFDVEKFKMILYRSWIFIALFFAITVTPAFLYIRYTPPTYESSSIIKLNFDSEASVLDISSPVMKQEGEISGEIELLKSRLFFSKLVEAVEMEVSYYQYGRLMDSERFRNSPFEVSYKIKNQNYNNRPIDLQVIDEESFRLVYDEFSQVFRFEEEIVLPELNLLVSKTAHFDRATFGRYYFIINTPEALVEYLVSRVEVVPESFTAKTLRISLQAYDKRKAQTLVHTIDSVYEIYTREAKNKALEQKIVFLDARIEATESVLQEYESYFENFTIENRSTNLGTDLNRTIARLEVLDSSHLNLRVLSSDIEILKKQLELEEPLLLNEIFIKKFPEGITNLLKTYQENVQDRFIKRSSYSENTFIIQRLNDEIGLIKTQLSSTVNSYQENISTQISNVVARKKALGNSLNQLPALETEYTKNRRFYGQQEEFMQSLRQAKMEMEITRAGTVTDIQVLSPASYPFQPVKPQKILIYGLGLITGLMISILFLLIRYLVNNKITRLSELERLVSVPILGSIPYYKQEKLVNTQFVIQKHSKSALSESLRTLRTNLEFMNGASDKQVISVSSTVSGEGKTFVGINFGGIIALSGQKVCIVDLDMRKPKIHLAFDKKDNSKGVSTILSGRSKMLESLSSTTIQNLYFIPAGPIPPNPSELLIGDLFDRLIDDLQKEFDVVILDTPPVGLVTDGILAMKKATIQLYVVRSGYSRREYVKTIENLKRTNQFREITIIFNSVIGSNLYGYGYYEVDSKKSGLMNSLKSFP